jgi:hypothetical protein
MILYIKRGGRATLPMLIITPACMLICATWAVVPDIPRMLGLSNVYYAMQANSWTNIFFLHQWIDKIEGSWFDPYTPLFNTLFMIIVILPLIAAWRELALRERT